MLGGVARKVKGLKKGDISIPTFFLNVDSNLKSDELCKTRNKISYRPATHSEDKKYRVAQKERMFFNLPAISFFGVTSNQKSTFENLV